MPRANSKPKPKLMTQKAYADLKGVTPQYVNKLVTQGKIAKVGRLIDRKQADAAIEAFRRPGRLDRPQRRADKRGARGKTHRGTAKASAHREPKIPRGETITQWRMQSEKFKALNLQLEHEKTVGNLLERDQVLAAERLKNERIRSAFRALPRSLAPVLSRCASAAEAESLLREELDRVLQRLAEDPFGMKEAAAIAVAETTEAEAMPAAVVQTSALESEVHA